MLQSIEGIYTNGIIKLVEQPKNIVKSRIIVTFLQTEPVTPTERMMSFGMFAGSNQSTEEDFQIAEFNADIDDNLDWT